MKEGGRQKCFHGLHLHNKNDIIDSKTQKKNHRDTYKKRRVS